MNNQQGYVSLVGAGPGDPGLLTLRAADALRRADVLLYDALASDATVAFAPSSCERIFVGKRGGEHAMPQADIETLMIAKARAGNHVVRLKGGDPFVFGRGGEEAQTLRAAGIEFQIVPGISSSIAAPAYAGIPVTHRDHNVAFTVVTGHEDPTKPASTLDWAKLADPHRTLVILMAMGNLDAIAKRLIEHGLPATTPAAVIMDGTRPEQRSVVGMLATIAEDAVRAELAAPAIVIVGDVVKLREELRWFDNTPLFGKRILITRPLDAAAAFASAVYARGSEPIIAPCIAIASADEPHVAHRAIDELASFRWLVFTSQHGVDAFFDRLQSLDADARYLGTVKVAAIGPKTAERLFHFGIRADLVPSTYIGEEIARSLIEASSAGDRVLVFRAQSGRDVLPQMLEDAGLRVTVVAGYKTVPARDDELAAKVASAHVMTFTSASTVQAFVDALGGPDAVVRAATGKTIACLGPVVADAARALGLTVDVVGETFTSDGLLDAIEAHFS